MYCWACITLYTRKNNLRIDELWVRKEKSSHTNSFRIIEPKLSLSSIISRLRFKIWTKKFTGQLIVLSQTHKENKFIRTLLFLAPWLGARWSHRLSSLPANHMVCDNRVTFRATAESKLSSKLLFKPNLLCSHAERTRVIPRTISSSPLLASRLLVLILWLDPLLLL